jgi:myo-inositol-1-phosphate synthase
MDNQQDYLAECLKKISELYKLSKEAIIFLEKYNPQKNTYIGPHNEVRNAFDHVMKMVNANDVKAVEEQYNGVRSHLLRAGCDAYELICTHCIMNISNILKSYDSSDISKGFPDYYQKGIRANIMEILEKLTNYKMREEPEISTVAQQFSDYYKSATELLNYSNDAEKHIPAMSACKEDRLKILQNKNNAKPAYLLAIIIGLSIIMVTLIISILFTVL